MKSLSRETLEPVVAHIRRHPETSMDHEAFQWLILVMRYALVVVPSLVTVPDRTEEEFLTAAALIQVCTCISIQITHKLLDDDIIGKSLLVEVLAPSVYRILVVASI